MTADLLSKVPTDLFIGGTWRAASEGGRFDGTDPATGDVIAQVADASAEDGLAAVAAAHQAGIAWAATPPRQRAEVLRKAWQLMTERADEIATLI
jgi:succinate-semialdehyde dehydrogenase / glutarate-semialdehyde dehydrogenase